MQIDNQFTVSVPIEQAWRVLTDLEGIAPCMPGAQLTGVDGDVYRGKVKIKVGPVTSEYAGTARFSEKNDGDYHAVIDAKGRDARGAGNASALITAQLTPEGEQTKVSVSTDLKISGRIAQFGSGMIKEVSTKLLGQFVDNLEARIGAGDGAASSGQPDATAPASGTQSPPAAGQPEPGQPAPGQSASGQPASGGSGPASGAGASGGAAATEARAGTQAQAGPAAGQQDSARPAPAPAGQAAEPTALNLMSIAGSSIYKRAIPLVIVLIVIIGLIIYFAVR